MGEVEAHFELKVDCTVVTMAIVYMATGASAAAYHTTWGEVSRGERRTTSADCCVKADEIGWPLMRCRRAVPRRCTVYGSIHLPIHERRREAAGQWEVATGAPAPHAYRIPAFAFPWVCSTICRTLPPSRLAYLVLLRWIDTFLIGSAYLRGN